MSACRQRLLLPLILFSILFAPRAAFAQSDTSALTVVVTDASGGVVPGASVELRSVATGATRNGTSDATGRVVFALVAPGAYDVTVSLMGFRQHRDTGVHLQVARPATLGVTLEVGALAETVEATSEARLLPLDSAAHGTVITAEKVEALPLNGRQFIQLALLVPGANAGGRAVQQNATGRLNHTGGISIGGGRTNNTLFLVDGAINTDPDYNSLSYSPSVEAIAEFQVQTSQFSAAYGRAGAQVNLITKSGSSVFHGSAFEFVRSGRFDSKPFNLVGDLPQFRRDNFGGSLGGPLVPGRLFFFGAFEQLRRREAASSLTTVTVPTALERQGDFSQSPGGGIYDPLSSNTNRTQFPNNTIPANRIDPFSLAAMLALPLPNSGTRNYVNTEEITKQDIGNGSLRLDLNAGRAGSIFGRISIADEYAEIPEPVPGRLNLSDADPVNAVVGWTRLFGTRVVNEARVGVSRLSLVSGLPEPSFTIGGQAQTIPRFLVGGYPAMGGAGAFTGTAGGGITDVSNRRVQIYDNVSWQQGSHSFKAGAEVLWTQYNRTEVPSTLGTFTFVSGYTSRTASNDGTGNALASFLLGLPQIANRAVGPSTLAGRQTGFAAYVQDDWRVTPTLTLNLGLRYEIEEPLWDRNGGMSNIDYSSVPTPAEIFAEGRLAFYEPIVYVCGQNGTPRGCANTDKNNLAPRFGFAWQTAPNVVVRGGAGIYYAPQDGNPLFRLAAGIPGNIAQALTFNAFVPANAPGYDIFGTPALGPVQIQQASIDIDQQASQATQWTIGSAWEFARDWVAEVNYTGTRGKYLEQNVQPNNAQPGLGAVDPRRPFRALRFAPNTQFPSYITVVGDTVPVGQVNYFPHSARSEYDALELRVEKRFSGGASLLSAYTFSDAQSNAPQYRNAGGANGAENSPPQDSHDLESEWGPAYYSARHRWVTSGIWTLPFGEGQPFLSSGVAAAIAGGFRVAGIVTLQSGFPFTVNLQGDTAGIGGGTGGILIRPNAVPGVDPYLPKSEWKNGRYLNPAAFETPPAGTFGNVGRNSIVGPDYASVDMVIMRSIGLGGGRRIDLRAEAFNLLNRRNYTLVGRLVNVNNFGQLLSQADPRQWQFGARFVF